MIVGTCQRWRDRSEKRVPAGPLIIPAHLAADVIDDKLAKPFVEQHHYSGTFPAARLSVGLFRRTHLVGVAVFSVPMNNAVVPKWTGLDHPNEGAELGRLVLLDDVEGNAESWFMARAFSAIAREKRIAAIVSYSDPVPRLNAYGSVVKPGHVGTVYQALSATYRGLASARTEYIAPCGTFLSRRALSKIRLEEVGDGYATDQLHTLGAPRRNLWERGEDWYRRLMAAGFFTTQRHPGNHTYVFPLSARAKGRVRRNLKVDEKTKTSAWPALAYPKIGGGA